MGSLKPALEPLTTPLSLLHPPTLPLPSVTGGRRLAQAGVRPDRRRVRRLREVGWQLLWGHAAPRLGDYVYYGRCFSLPSLSIAALT